MAKYVDGFVLPVPKKNVQAYRRHAAKAGKVFRKYGALDFKECRGDDMKPMEGVTLFPRLIKAKPSEVVFFSFIVYKSKADRQRITKRVMKDPEIMKMMIDEMPFDVKRMAVGGFRVLVDV